MYRFRDVRGLTRNLADAEELRTAIINGEIRPGSPFADEEGAWTVASMHPAYQEAAKGVKPAKVGGAGGANGGGRGVGGVDWGRLGNSAVGRLGMVALVTVAALVAFKDQHVSPAERDRFLRDLTVMVEQEDVPLAMQEPPAAKALQPAWAIMSGVRDVLRHMDETQARLGFTDDGPPSWMTNHHVIYPRQHPEVEAHWTAVQRFHEIYRDSLMPLTEAAVRKHAERAGIRGRRLDGLSADLEPMRANIFIHETGVEMARAGLTLHNLLIRFAGRTSIDYSGDLVFEDPYSADYYSAAADKFDILLARMDSLEMAGTTQAAENLAKLRK